MEYQAVVLDVDGTLVSRRSTRPSETTLRTISQLQARGILVMVATGRSFFVANESVLGFRADYSVCANGAYAVDADGRHLFDERLSLDQTERIIALCAETDGALGMAFSDANYVYYRYDWYLETYRALVGGVPYIVNGESRDQHLRELPYGAFCFVRDQAMQRFCAENEDLTAAAYAPGMYDVFRRDLNKAEGIRRLLHKIGLQEAQLVAVGDGENDHEMLALAGCGVAMGNGSAKLRAAADYVTATVDEDGAARAMRELFRLP